MNVITRPSQYRPISLLSVISNICEAVINKKVVDHLNKKNVLNEKQYGFPSA